MSSSVGSGSGHGSSPPKAKGKMNLRSTAVKRIMQEASELADPSEDDFIAAPLENDIFEWHCTMRGVKDSEYEGGLYHLRILLPPTYPMSAPDIILLTPNGRFELGKKICIDGLTSFHAGSWQPAWGVRTAVLGLRSFWMQGGEAMSAIGALDYSKEERRRLAKSSLEWECPDCGKMKNQIPERHTIDGSNNDHHKHEHEHDHQKPSAESQGLQAGSQSSRPQQEAGSEPVSDLEVGPEAGSEVEVRREGGHRTHTDTNEVAGPSPDAERAAQPDSDEAVLALAVPPTQSQSQSQDLTPTPTTQITNMPTPPLTAQGRHAPIWIDALIVAGLAVLVTLLYRKISTPSNMIETVSL